MNKKAHGLIEVEATQLPNWLAIPLVILICITFIVVILFLSVVIYSCYKGNCNGYYGVPVWVYRTGPVLGFRECTINGVPVNCSEINYTPQGSIDKIWSDGTYSYNGFPPDMYVYYSNGSFKEYVNDTDWIFPKE